MTHRTVKLAVIAGDGIGPEVTTEALKVLRAVPSGLEFQATDFPFGAGHYLATGDILTDEDLDAIKDPTRSCSARSVATPATRSSPAASSSAGCCSSSASRSTTT